MSESIDITTNFSSLEMVSRDVYWIMHDGPSKLCDLVFYH